MQDKRIARIVREAFLNEPLLKGFTDIRKRPVIPLRTILTSLFLMPFFGLASLLSNDRETRTERYKGLYGCRRKMVASDSTFARILGWLKRTEAEAFLLSLLGRFEAHELLRKSLSVGGRPRRMGILDGSYMGGHRLVTLCLAGQISYPVVIRRYLKNGDELEVARQLMREAPAILKEARPELWLVDALYFNEKTIAIAREQESHILFKFKDADYREVSKDAQNLFEHFGGDEEKSGWDNERQCQWKVRKTVDRFAGYPMQVVELSEYSPKREERKRERCWIVTTDLELPLEELREAAHQRWQIENRVFKRISHLSGTKRFYFKDHRQFFNLLHLFFAAVAVLDCIMALLRSHPRLLAALRDGIKGTWRNVFSRIREVLFGLPCAFARLK
jgi:hypothetical protein